MKSLHKASPTNPPIAWDPPTLESEAQTQPPDRAEQISRIFQKTEEEEQSPKKYVRKLGQKQVNLWQPETLSKQIESAARVEEWSFIEVKDTPFDKTWRVKSPGTVTELKKRAEGFEIETEKYLEKARQQAEEIILTAQSQADEILTQAEAEIGEQKQLGRQQASEEVRAEFGEALQAIKATAMEVEAWRNALTSQGETILVGMIKDIAVKMFGEGVELDARALQTNLNRVMDSAHGLGAVKIFLNPRDAHLLDSYWAEQQMLVLGEQVKIVPSSKLKPGGCVVKGNMGIVDGRVESQLSAILKTFDEAAE